MRIAAIHIYRYDIPLAHALTIKRQTLRTRSGVIVRVTDDTGASGYGDVAPLPGFSVERLDETVCETVRVARSLTGCAVPDMPGRLSDHFERWMRPHNLSPSLNCGLQTAVLELHAAGAGRSLAQYLNADAAREVRVNALISGDVEESAAQACSLREAGVTAAKLKVGHGKDISEDVEKVRRVRDALGDDVELRLDANRAWDYDDAVRFGRGVAACRIEFIEEPLRDPTRLVAYSAETGVPVALDETVVERGFDALERWRGVKAVVLKPTLLGGFEIAFWMARRAWNVGMTPVISSAFESGIGLGGLAHLAAAMNQPRVAAGLDTYRWLAEDVRDEPLQIVHGVLDLDQVCAARTSINYDRMIEVEYE